MGDLERSMTPDRDAVIWSVDTSNFYCLVKIQGSPTTIKAHYPRNWRTVPTWLKPGNAVRIRHRSGVQGYIEVEGHGRAIPTPVEGDSLPPQSGLPDGIITGMEIMEYEGGGMNVIVNNGTYRIDGETYVFTISVSGYIVMDDPAPMIMGSNTVMGWYDTTTAISIAAAPAAGYGRYDALVVAADGTVDVVTGSVSSLGTEPSYPSIPADHILIGYLFIYGGMTSISADDIGVRWTAPAASTVSTSATGVISKQADGSFEMTWDGGDNYPDDSITYTIKDQYGRNFGISTTMEIELISGTGKIGISSSGPWVTSASKSIGYSTTAHYQRDQTQSPEVIPIIRVDFVGFPSLTTVIPLILLDSGGDPI